MDVVVSIYCIMFINYFKFGLPPRLCLASCNKNIYFHNSPKTSSNNNAGEEVVIKFALTQIDKKMEIT